jgi:hypothetical protein
MNLSKTGQALLATLRLPVKSDRDKTDQTAADGGGATLNLAQLE